MRDKHDPERKCIEKLTQQVTALHAHVDSLLLLACDKILFEDMLFLLVDRGLEAPSATKLKHGFDSLHPLSKCTAL
jgi:hypothetical protein